MLMFEGMVKLYQFPARDTSAGDLMLLQNQIMSNSTVKICLRR